jgi:hypothetical protein
MMGRARALTEGAYVFRTSPTTVQRVVEIATQMLSADGP